MVSLAEAREQALHYRKIARDGGDPSLIRKREQVEIPTFEKAAEQVHEERRSTWRNAKHAQQWINTLRQYAYPEIGKIRVDLVDTPAVLRALAPIWLTKAETARRLRQRIGIVLDWAKAAGFREGDNPVSGVTKGLPKQPAKEGHHAALPYRQVPAFVARLQKEGDGELARLAMEFLILTASRTSEVLNARWAEVDLDGKTWIVPAERMKAKRAHRVPLAPRCLEILQRAKYLAADSPLVFPGRTNSKPMSNMVLLSMLKRMEVPATTHGFRSSFRDWAAETTSFPRELAEMALAHTIENKVEAAYRRGDLFEKRRTMMEAWAEYCEGAG